MVLRKRLLQHYDPRAARADALGAFIRTSGANGREGNAVAKSREVELVQAHLTEFTLEPGRAQRLEEPNGQAPICFMVVMVVRRQSGGFRLGTDPALRHNPRLRVRHLVFPPS